MLEDFGPKVSVDVWGDAPAALGITNRNGLGKTRPILIGLPWVQQDAPLRGLYRICVSAKLLFVGSLIFLCRCARFSLTLATNHPQCSSCITQISPAISIPNSLYIAIAPDVSADARKVAYASNSPGLNATKACVLLQPFMVRPPTGMTPPAIWSRDALQPAQSASLQTTN